MPPLVSSAEINLRTGDSARTDIGKIIEVIDDPGGADQPAGF